MSKEKEQKKEKPNQQSQPQNELDLEAIEKKWQSYWEKENIYAFEKKSKKPTFSIDVPPVYASAGHLHIGHALHYTQFEIIARLKRMQGHNVYFAPCFDDNGLPTEKYVEEKFHINKNTTTKAAFRKLCLEEAKKVEQEYSDRVFKKLGHGYDWSLLYTTISPEAQIISQSSFIDLYNKGECYQAEEPTIWCTKHQTALAQAEVEDAQRTTTLNYIEFDLDSKSKEHILIATTRPEFLSACVGIFVNPEDKRHKKLIGKEAIVPIFNQKVKIMSDEKVDQNFGTGIVMICTFGDTTDIEWWKKHKLDLRSIVTKEGKLVNSGVLNGLSLNEAKKKAIEILKEQGRLKKQESLNQTLGTCWRCSTPVEFIVTKQWFIKTLKHKKELIEQGKKIAWYPEFYRTRYDDWVNNLRWDWCISRQRFYGVPIPAWYCKKCGQITLADKKQLPVDPEKDKPKAKCKCGSSDFEPEQDVFDTWMTSSMTPQIASRTYDGFKPLSLRPQSHDIIRTWAFYTILKSHLLFKKIPWQDIAIGTFVLDPQGKGMHKSKGNAVWFDELYDKYKSVDVIRYWVGTATFGEDLPFQEKELVAGKKFLTKLWNASKFLFMNLEGFKPKFQSKTSSHSNNLIDHYFIEKFDETIREVDTAYDKYAIGEAKRKAEQYFWHDFCDNYLEIVKKRIYQGTEKEKEQAQATLYLLMLKQLKLFAPIIPHLTEELYQMYFKEFEKTKSIHLTEWPKAETKINEKIKKAGDKFIEILSQVRQEKSKAQKSMKSEIILTIPKEDKAILKDMLTDLQEVTHAKEIKQGDLNIEIL
jgi:valyl-tRNA synthetase